MPFVVWLGGVHMWRRVFVFPSLQIVPGSASDTFTVTTTVTNTGSRTGNEVVQV